MIVGTIEQEFRKNKYLQEIYTLEQKIKMLRNEIINIDMTICRECVVKHGDHVYTEEVDTGPYPDTWYICKYCGCEK